jgi:hypothetical protein
MERRPTPQVRVVAREIVCRVATTAPQQLGLPFTTWSLSKLVEHLGAAHRIVASAETVRPILREAGISWQASKTWKGSRDPEFAVKMARILDLYARAAAGQIPEGGRVICVDEFGPLNLQPRPGRSWFPRRRPGRRRATYTRTGGVRHMLAALDLASGQLFYRFRDRKRWQEFLGFLRQLRVRFPAGGCSSCATTSRRTRNSRSAAGVLITTWSWCSPRATRPG